MGRGWGNLKEVAAQGHVAVMGIPVTIAQVSLIPLACTVKIPSADFGVAQKERNKV